MYRRDFNLSLLKTSVAVILAPGFTARAFIDDLPPVSALYSKAVVIDSLCAPLGDLEAAPSAEALAAVRQSGITAINFTIAVPDFDETVYNLANVQKLVDDYPDAFVIVRRYSDIARCKRDNKLGIILGFQQTWFLEQDPERIATFRNLGVRIMQLTYNKHSIFGDGCLEPSNGSLTKAGHQCR